MLSPVEMYMIQTGKRFFKGIEDYNDLLRFQFDLETTGLDPTINRIFSIGVRTNKGIEKILKVVGETPDELRRSELEVIETFFEIIDIIKPDLISGYNSENFDFHFLEKRCEMLGSNIGNFAKSINGELFFKRKKDSTVKYGQDTEYYTQTLMYGYNITDIYHSVRRAQAINSNIKKADLKYITRFSKINKPNRVYVKGDMIFKIWSDINDNYAFNDVNGDWYKVTDKKPFKEGYRMVNGEYIVDRYLMDDLWETEQVDFSFNQATFLLSKLLPTTYSKTSTTGTASIWKLIMCAWSYENHLAIPSLAKKEDFTGGLSRLIECGYIPNVMKADYAALYPNTELTHGIFPPFDISGVMEGFLLYITETRDISKELKNKHSDRAKDIKKQMGVYEKDGMLTPELKEKCLKAIAKHEKLSKDYDKKQLPIKILANSFFGSFGAPYIFPWGDISCAEETTCRGRQYLRLMVRFFYEKYGFRPIVLDTDGVNFAIPDNANTFEYLSNGNHRFNEKDKLYKGIYAPVAEFNDNYMTGRMGLDIDEIAESTINFSRKNYADLIDGDVKLVGNSIKSKTMETYIEEFFDVGVRMLLEGKGFEFIQYYQEYVDKIYNYQIPISKIASKGRVKSSINEYIEKTKRKNKRGNPMPRQAHMELLIKHDINPDLGDTVYYVNVGKKKDSGDIKSIKNKETGKTELELNCRLIPRDDIENDVISITEEYNVAKYLDKFNKKIKPLLVVFNSDIRPRILVNTITDRKTKITVLSPKYIFTRLDTELVRCMPYKDEDQDTYEELMTMENKEIRFWLKAGKTPNHMTEEEWREIVIDYNENKINQLKKNVESEIELIKKKVSLIPKTTLSELKNMFLYVREDFYEWVIDELGCDLDYDETEEEFFIKSKRWDEKLMMVDELFQIV